MGADRRDGVGQEEDGGVAEETGVGVGQTLTQNSGRFNPDFDVHRLATELDQAWQHLQLDDITALTYCVRSVQVGQAVRCGWGQRGQVVGM